MAQFIVKWKIIQNVNHRIKCKIEAYSREVRFIFLRDPENDSKFFAQSEPACVWLRRPIVLRGNHFFI